MGERVHEAFEDVVTIDLIHPPQEPAIAIGQNLAGLVPGLFVEYVAQCVVLHALSPDRVELLAAGRPRLFAAIELVVLIDREVRLGFEDHESVFEALANTRAIHLEHFVDRVERLALDHVVELVPVALEVLDVAREQVHAIAIERLDIAVEHVRGQIVVDGDVIVVRLLDELSDQLTDVLVPLFGLEQIVGDDRVVRGQRGKREGCDKQSEHSERAARLGFAQRFTPFTANTVLSGSIGLG